MEKNKNFTSYRTNILATLMKYKGINWELKKN